MGFMLMKVLAGKCAIHWFSLFCVYVSNLQSTLELSFLPPPHLSQEKYYQHYQT